MSYFAELDDKNIVLRVVSVPDDQEHRGEEYLAKDVGLGGRWIQTSFNARIRKRFAGIGDYYDSAKDAFVPQKPSENVVWDDELFDWKPAEEQQ